MMNKQKPLTRILTEEHLRSGIDQLKEIDPAIAAIVNQLPSIPLRNRAPGFEGLAEIITAQQVSKASASAIFSRMKTLIEPLDAGNFLAAGEEPLIAAGQSRAKQTTLTNLANAIINDEIDLDALCFLPVDEALDQLTQLKGIGPWTAEVFLLFCAGHADIFPAGDVALQHAVAHLLKLDQKPDVKQTREISLRWAPLRGVAARVLYADYAFRKGRSAI